MFNRITKQMTEYFLTFQQRVLLQNHTMTHAIQDVFILLTISLLLLGGYTTVQSQPYPKLFSDITFSKDTETAASQRELISQKKEAERLNPVVVRSRYVQVNMDILKTEHHILLNFFEDTEMVAARTSISSQTSDQFIWKGSITNATGGTVTLVREK